MNALPAPDQGRRLAGWTALTGGIIAWFSLYCFYAAIGSDFDAVFHPATALSLDAKAQQWFRVGALADLCGFYLAMLIVGGYFWSTLRCEGGPLIDVAVLALLAYVVFGISGAAMQCAALPALAQAYAAGDATVALAAQSAWLAMVSATERGLWWAEGPVMALWAALMWPVLRRRGRACAPLLMACGALYLLWFAAEFLQLRAFAELTATLGELLLPLWLVLTGIGLLRSSAAGESSRQVRLPLA